MKNIFIMGAAGSGKDTLAYELWNQYYYERFALADPIREEYKRFFPLRNPRTDRERLIRIGQTYKELYGQDVWVRETLKMIENFRGSVSNDVPVIITDGRYAIEYEVFVNDLNFVSVRIECPESIRLERLKQRDGTCQEGALKKESTELTLAPAYVIDNSGDQEYLVKQIEAMMAWIGEIYA